MEDRRTVILVVDDEPGVLKLTRSVLARAGYEVLAAPTAKDAREICGTYDGRIDAAILDIIMPDEQGLELCPELLVMRPDMKVMFMGGYPSELVVGSKRAGAPFIQKPFDPAGLVERVRALLDQADTAA